MITEEGLKELHKISSYHRGELEECGFGGCFYCRQTFNTSEVKEWIDSQQTALCPKCGIDSVLPLDRTVDHSQTLLEMSMYWFNLVFNEEGKLVHDFASMKKLSEE